MTRYGPGLSYTMTRAWVTWDGKEIANMSTIEKLIETHVQKKQAARTGEPIIATSAILSRDNFERAVEVYLDSPIETSLASDDPIVKALAMFDRRLGKRRLQKLDLGETEHPMVKQFYMLRCEAEGLTTTDLAH